MKVSEAEDLVFRLRLGYTYYVYERPQKEYKDVCICVMAADTGKAFRWRKCAGYHFPLVPAEWEIKSFVITFILL